MHLELLASSHLPVTLAVQGAVGGGLIWTILIGIVIGALAKLIVGGREPVGCIITMIIGIAGSIIALYVGKAVGHYQVGETPGFIASLIGAIVLLLVYHLIVGRGPKV